MTTFPPSQLQALSDFYSATNGAKWSYYDCTVSQRWNFVEGANPCTDQWCGIKCFPDTMSVQQLNLLHNELDGTIPESINLLDDLEILDLSDNVLYGTIPTSLLTMTKLKSLSLDYNQLQGSIPNIFSNESSLMSLDFSSNHFEGRLPSSFKMLNNIIHVVLNNNNLFGQLSDWITPRQFSQLRYLDIRSNMFSGVIPNATNVTGLIALMLTNNNFERTIPDIFYNSSHFQFLYLSNNQFTGSLPPSLLNERMKNIYLDQNLFDGRIDNYDWSVMQLLSSLSMANNYLTGQFPQSLCFESDGYLTTGSFVNLGFNFFHGHLNFEQCQRTLYSLIQFLTLQGNFFTGALHGILDGSQVHRLMGLTLSNNELTGTIPATIFPNLPEIEILSLGTNCLSGTLPNEICTAKLLSGLSIEGASSGDSCKIPIVDLPSLGLNAFVTRKSLTGTIPPCLFSLPHLSSLSLSGNKLTGTLPLINNSVPLVNASLSYNQLTGTISPLWYQNKWELLDLSYNKFDGTFPESSKIFSNQRENTIISLEVNRLSGTIPSSFTSMNSNLNILKGNMLSCGWGKQELPQNDPDFATYTCGSNMVNNSIYLWLLGSIFTVFIVFIMLLKKVHKGLRRVNTHSQHLLSDSFVRNLLLDNSSSYPVLLQIPSKYPSILSFFSFTLHVRQYAVLALCFILVVLMPVYAVLGVYYRTYDERYAWTISAIFLSGTNATITLMVFFVLFIVFAVVVVHGLFRKAVREYYDRHVYCVRSWLRWRVVVLWTIAWLINGAIMLTADSVYVYLIINRSTKYEYLIQITLAMFKLAWHDIGIFRMIHTLKRLIDIDNSMPLTEVDEPLIINSIDAEDYKPLTKRMVPTFHTSLLTTLEMRYLIYMSIVNKAMIPCLAILFISSSCFYNALFSAEPHSSYYLLYYDDNISVNLLGSREDDASFTPAFNYSYQCSSAFLTDYIPVFVFMLLWSSVVLPGIIFLVSNLSHLFSGVENQGIIRKALKVIGKSLLPIGWGEIEKTDFKTKASNLVLHRKQLLTLRISYTFAVMFVFGSLFPPLALIAVIGIMNITMLEEYLMKRMFDQCSSSQSELNIEGEGSSLSHFPPSSSFCSLDYMEYVEEECKDIDRNWFKVKKLIVYLTCVLLGFVLFDVCGDRNGWREGMIPMVLMIVFPLVLFALIAFIAKRKTEKSLFMQLYPYSI